jgi:phage gpG-like protein
MIGGSIQVPPNLDAALRGLKPDVMVSSIRRGMNRGTQLVTDLIRRNRLTGQGPFAVSAHQLGVRSGRLRKSLYNTPAVVSGMEITTAIGAKVGYAAAHEFGFKGKVPIKAHNRTIKKAFGVKLKAASTHAVKAHQRSVNIPERAPIRTGINENLAVFSNEISREVTSTFGRA